MRRHLAWLLIAEKNKWERWRPGAIDPVATVPDIVPRRNKESRDTVHSFAIRSSDGISGGYMSHGGVRPS